jgi:hypothetical protein
MSASSLTTPTTAERRSWNDLDSKTQESLLSLMPKDVRARVRRGDIPSEAEVEELIKKHYDLGLLMLLWLVKDGDTNRLNRSVFGSGFAAPQTYTPQAAVSQYSRRRVQGRPRAAM